ncbi:MAG: hypothetical protein H0V71_05140 [Chloroflexi bacterium]|nr:hypothetical protein [Chloroflexota bacterium]
MTTLDRIGRDRTHKDIAAKFGISINTVANLAANAYRKLGAHSAAAAVLAHRDAHPWCAARASTSGRSSSASKSREQPREWTRALSQARPSSSGLAVHVPLQDQDRTSGTTAARACTRCTNVAPPMRECARHCRDRGGGLDALKTGGKP